MKRTENKRKSLFIVDDNLTNLNIARDILSKKYNVITIPSALKMFEMLNKTIPDIILLDIEMPEMNGYDAIKLLKDDDRYKSIPVIFITVRGDSASELAGLALGAVDYISKPFAPQLLAKRIEIHATLESQKEQLKEYNDNLTEMVSEKVKEVMGLQDTIISTIAELMECRELTTNGHIFRTQKYLKIFLEVLGKNEMYKDEVGRWRIDEIVQSCRLHDLGKIAIRDSVLKKTSKLTHEEFEEIKSHAAYGVEMIDKIERNSGNDAFLEHARIFAGTHHEKWDGTGYPEGLKGEEIPLQGRLMAIADVYDALISERPYKKAFPHGEAVRIIEEGSGTYFDPNLVDVFLMLQDDFKNASIERVDAPQFTHFTTTPPPPPPPPPPPIKKGAEKKKKNI
ncbi:MAG: response regulator [Oscillospiraceae bacterium]|nr:response regulator [Oscillospiraceae bacterium]